MSNDPKTTSITSENTGIEPEPSPPDEKLDYIDLGAYIKKHILIGDRFEGEAKELTQRTTVHRWYAGAALKIVQDRETKEGKWVAWCKTHGFTVSTCYEAIRLFVRSGSVENVRNLDITTARKKYQTSSKTFKPEGTPPEPTPEVPKIKYEETEPLKELQAEFGKFVEVVSGIQEDEWKNADPEIYLGQIDDLRARLRLMRQSIVKAQKTAVAEQRANSQVTANATVVKESAQESASVTGAVSVKGSAQQPTSVKPTAKPPTRKAAKVSPK